MKRNLIYILNLFQIIFLFSCKSQVKKKSDFEYYFTGKGIENCNCPESQWTKINKQTAVFNFGFRKGSCCGEVPNPDYMKSKIINDTIFFTNGNNFDPTCNSSIGTCGSNPLFVINIKKYPNYDKLKWKGVNEIEFNKIK